jgi:hypothetical protein
MCAGLRPQDDAVMALKRLSAEELADTPTLFASFMGAIGRRPQTIGQLLAIYRERSGTIGPGDDSDNDLRVGRFAEDMASNRWRSDVVLRLGVFDGAVLVIDGIHRAMAYLACVEAGVSPDRLPALHVSV